MNQFEKMLSDSLGEMTMNLLYEDEKTTPVTAEELAELGKRYMERHEFKPGDLVMFKEGMGNCHFPKYGEPGVVVDIMEGMRTSSDNSGSSHQYEPCDVRVGVIYSDGNFECFWIDSHRLTFYKQPNGEK